MPPRIVHFIRISLPSTIGRWAASGFSLRHSLPVANGTVLLSFIGEVPEVAEVQSLRK
jgi:hypothetical protein